MAGQSASCFDQDDANASSIKNHEHGGENVIYDKIAGMLQSVKSLPKSKCCIYKVSGPNGKSNKEAYTPQVISIGPIHCNNTNLKTMESFKLTYFNDLMEREKHITLKHLVTTIKPFEGRVRECYSEIFDDLNSADFVTMILVDAIFIIEFFRKKWSKNWSEYDRRILTPWLSIRLHLDLMLLENQLPFFIIEEIYVIAFPSLAKDHPFIELSFNQFEYYNVQKFGHHDPDRDSESSRMFILHFTDLVRNFCLPPPQSRQQRNSESIKLEMHSATQLAEVGLKFKMSKPSKNRSQLELKYANGELEIPCFQLDDMTEIYARNLVALEECHYPEEAYITEYYILLSFLIKTGKDVDLLVRKQIIDNWLDGDVATSMINKLSEKSLYFQMNSQYYHEMAKALKDFYDHPPMLITWRRALFSSPLIGASAISAFLLLLFTLVQSVSSVLSLKYFN